MMNGSVRFLLLACSRQQVLGGSTLRAGAFANSTLFQKQIYLRTREISRSISKAAWNLNLKKNDSKRLPEEHVDIGEGTWSEIYNGILSTQIRLVKTFSLGTSLIGILTQPLLYQKLGTVNLAAFLGLASFIGFFSFVTPFMIHWVSKKYVIKLEYDCYRDIYAATTYSFLLREHKIEFNPKDVIRPDIPGMFTSFKVHGKPLFIDPEMFNDIEHYVRIMGFDKPIDLRRNEDKSSKS